MKRWPLSENATCQDLALRILLSGLSSLLPGVLKASSDRGGTLPQSGKSLHFRTVNPLLCKQLDWRADCSSRRKVSNSKPPDGEMRQRIIPESWVRWWLYGSTRRTVARSATRLSVSGEQSQKAPRISSMSHTFHCKKRARWRLQTKKPSELLSSYYRLNCEYGTSLMMHWQRGGTGPLYVCEDHAKTLSLIENRAALGTT